MVCCISLGKLDKCFFAVLFGSVFCFLNRFLNQYKSKLAKHVIVHNIYISGSKLLGIIPYLISIRSYKDDLQNERLMKNTILREAHTNEIRRITQTKWRYLFISAFAFFVNQVVFVITTPIKTNTPNLNILFTSLFYYLFFKNKLYRHHYLSCALIIIIGVTIDLILGNLQNDVTTNIGLFLLRILREALYSLSCTIDKYVMERKFISVYLLLLSNGIINVIILGIFVIFDYFFFKVDDYKDYFGGDFSVIELLVALGTIITQFSLNLGILLTNKYYSPCHIFIIFVCGQLAVYVNIPFSWKMIVVIICLLFILFFSLIFNEIFEINVCGLSYNTKRNISKRAAYEDIDLYLNKDRDTENDLEGEYELTLKYKDNLRNSSDSTIHNDEENEKDSSIN